MDRTQWAKDLRSSIKSRVGFSVTDDRGRVRLQYRRTGQRSASIGLPFSWGEGLPHHVSNHINFIADAVDQGLDLKTAAQKVNGASSQASEDWVAALQAFRTGPQRRLKDNTWQCHARDINKAIAILQGPRPPHKGQDLLDRVLPLWEDGSRSQRLASQRIRKFLSYCVKTRHFNALWLASDQQSLPARKPKRVGYPFSDPQVLRIVDGMPDTESGRRYRFAFQLMAVYGLRPADLHFLHVRNNGTELWSGYRKSKGGKSGAKTEPRRLYALNVLDLDGTPQEWNLLQRVALGEALPPLGSISNAARALGRYLHCQPVWQSIKAEAAAEQQIAVLYGFRHRYAYTAHNRPMANGQMRSPKMCADAMGHDLETHLASYARFATRDLASAFDEGLSPALDSAGLPYTLQSLKAA